MKDESNQTAKAAEWLRNTESFHRIVVQSVFMESLLEPLLYQSSIVFFMFHSLHSILSLFLFFLGVPAHLRGKEFIYRNANNLHVSEFQTFIKSHLVVRTLVYDFSSVRLLM